MSGLEGKVTVVTGAGDGIGLGIEKPMATIALGQAFRVTERQATSRCSRAG